MLSSYPIWNVGNAYLLGVLSWSWSSGLSKFISIACIDWMTDRNSPYKSSLLFFLFYFQRVKVYRLNDDGKWDDQGTGHVSVDYMEVRSYLSIYWCLSDIDKQILESKELSHYKKNWLLSKTFHAYWLNANFISQRTEELGLFVVDEEDNETLLLHRISSDDIYRKQEGIFVFQLMIYMIFLSQL